MIIPLEPWHLIMVAMKMRPEDVIDGESISPGIDRQRWACKRALEPGISFTAIDSSGVPVACFGFLEEAKGRCTAWLVATPRWCPYLKSMVRCFRLVAEEGNYRRIQAFVRADRPSGRKFLKWLGFSLDGPLPGMCADGSQMELYSWRAR